MDLSGQTLKERSNPFIEEKGCEINALCAAKIVLLVEKHRLAALLLSVNKSLKANGCL
jgi:hypothetical protein